MLVPVPGEYMHILLSLVISVGLERCEINVSGSRNFQSVIERFIDD